MHDKRSHLFIPGVGYVRFSSVPRQFVPISGREVICLPAAGTLGGTWHTLTRGGGRPIRMRWDARGRQWEPMPGRGSRMAFTAEYLAHHGWKYEAPCPV